jgi:hypothetical protein
MWALAMLATTSVPIAGNQGLWLRFSFCPLATSGWMHFLASPAHGHRHLAGAVVEYLQTSVKAFAQDGGGYSVGPRPHLGLLLLCST